MSALSEVAQDFAEWEYAAPAMVDDTPGIRPTLICPATSPVCASCGGPLGPARVYCCSSCQDGEHERLDARPERLLPYLDSQGDLVIPIGCPDRYRHWTEGGQTLAQTLTELGASPETIARYTLTPVRTRVLQRADN